MKTIMVQMADQEWTTQAVHAACAMARSQNARVVMVRLMSGGRMQWLGTECGELVTTSEEYQALKHYAQTAEDYGVEFIVQPMQFLSVVDALVQIADELDADEVFARVPESIIPLWQSFQKRSLERQFHTQQRMLHTLDPMQREMVRVRAVRVNATK